MLLGSYSLRKVFFKTFERVISGILMVIKAFLFRFMISIPFKRLFLRIGRTPCLYSNWFLDCLPTHQIVMTFLKVGDKRV